MTEVREKQMTSDEIKTQNQLRDAVLRAVEQNHIWVDSFSIIRPSDDVLKKIGQAVVNMLRQKDNLLPAYHGEQSDDPVMEIQKLTPCLYLYVNAS